VRKRIPTSIQALALTTSLRKWETYLIVIQSAPARRAWLSSLSRGFQPRAFEHRLNEAGIWTFADLVNADTENLREMVSSGRLQNMIQVEGWIEQAREWVE